MMRRFGRRRRSTTNKATPIDAARWLERIRDEGVLGTVEELTPLTDLGDEIPASYAAVGTGTTPEGKALLVAFSPRAAGDALLAGLAAATRGP